MDAIMPGGMIAERLGQPLKGRGALSPETVTHCFRCPTPIGRSRARRRTDNSQAVGGE